METNPRSKAPPRANSCVDGKPKNATATGIAILPPKITSAN